jgi:hypothetical protein
MAAELGFDHLPGKKVLHKRWRLRRRLVFGIDLSDALAQGI